MGSPQGQVGQALSRLPGHYLLPAGQGPPPTLAHPAQTHVPKVEGDFQLTPEAVREGRVHVQHLQQVCPLDLVQVAVRQGPHVCTGLARLGVEANRLPEDVILSCQPEGWGSLQGLAPSSLLRIFPEGPLSMTSLSPQGLCQAGSGAKDEALGTRLDVPAGDKECALTLSFELCGDSPLPTCGCSCCLWAPQDHLLSESPLLVPHTLALPPLLSWGLVGSEGH